MNTSATHWDVDDQYVIILFPRQIFSNNKSMNKP